MLVTFTKDRLMQEGRRSGFKGGEDGSKDKQDTAWLMTPQRRQEEDKQGGRDEIVKINIHLRQTLANTADRR